MTLKQLAERIDVPTNRIEVEFYGKCKKCKKIGGSEQPGECEKCAPVVLVTVTQECTR
jgi:hypothetical protein